jgi:hypothetical protein
MPKRSYRKKSGKKSYRKKVSKKSYRKKGSKKGSKKSYRKKASKKVSKRRRTIRKVRKASPCVGLDEAECGYNPSCEYKTNKKGTKYCKSRAGTLYKKKLSKRLTKVQGPMGPPAGYVKEEKKELDKAEAVLDKKEEKLEDAIVAGAPAAVIAELKEEVKEQKEVVEEKLEKLEEKVEEAKELNYSGDLEFNLPALGFRIRRRVKGSKRGKKSRKTSRGKKSRGKKSRGKKHSKRRRNSGSRSRHMY